MRISLNTIITVDLFHHKETSDELSRLNDVIDEVKHSAIGVVLDSRADISGFAVKIRSPRGFRH